jgi:hypothetical protein
MKKYLILAALLLFPVPALAVDCSLDATACRCVGAIYKDPALSAPGDLTIRVFNWQRAGRRLNRRLLDQQLVSLYFSYESFGTHICCEPFNNGGLSVPYDRVTVTYIEAEAGELDKILIGGYDAAPEYGDWNEITNGDATTDVSFSLFNEVTTNVATSVLNGDSRAIGISKNQTLITRAITNRKLTLENKILDEGCALP